MERLTGILEDEEIDSLNEAYSRFLDESINHEVTVRGDELREVAIDYHYQILACKKIEANKVK